MGTAGRWETAGDVSRQTLGYEKPAAAGPGYCCTAQDTFWDTGPSPYLCD